MWKSLAIVLLAAGLAEGVSAQEPKTPSGPAVGEALPAFAAVDQDGVERDFRSLTGREGLLLLFHRSADW